jgi:CheY-like chemotaxis protein
MNSFIAFVQANKPWFDAAHALGAVVNLVGWCVGGLLLWIAWRRNRIQSVSVGPINFRVLEQQEAVVAAATAARSWSSDPAAAAGPDVPRIRETIAKAFEPAVADTMMGKSVLWVDDNPANNELVVRALKKLNLDVVQATSTEAGLAELQRRRFDLVISDMGRGTNMRAGYDLLKAIRDQGSKVPFLIFAGEDKPEYRRDAAERGAQLSTNSMLELMDKIIDHLGIHTQGAGPIT